ncbi:MBL fold metallo-hydrolase [Phytohabitans sp. ZYX-F-186]|uniref:MBL fold metallo-hydrolase n=1 Tax=Phytohabitans maris TaxID=3071409 RepID=A0ABU0ZNE8_9ACTN|nr:MBL fold metallo-hydrolase [Phytohabitans sp. ZYX-F-186]MDQ7908563.1 MBL fold metallo-hydrolase [Phytohabitans sp. ZYX-F-186]
MKVTGVLQQRAWATRELPPVEQVRPGLWSVPVPIPDNPLRYTLVYAVRLARGLALVDAGWAAETSWRSLTDGLAGIGYAVTDVRFVLVTHAHMDHLGLAARIREVSGAAVGMHPAEAATLTLPPGRAESVVGWLTRRGASRADAAEQIERMAGWRAAFEALARPDLLVEHGDRPLPAPAAIRAVWTPGHTPGHLCFVDEERDVMFTGDHVLPRISPNISVPPGGAGDPLGDFLSSLSTVDHAEPGEVLPAHEYRFTGLAARREALLAHHRTRLAEAEAAVRADPGASTWAVAATLSWSRPWSALGPVLRQFAVGETYAHLLHLAALGRVVNQDGPRDAWSAVHGVSTVA